jgi:hypothetical protein
MTTIHDTTVLAHFNMMLNGELCDDVDVKQRLSQLSFYCKISEDDIRDWCAERGLEWFTLNRAYQIYDVRRLIRLYIQDRFKDSLIIKVITIVDPIRQDPYLHCELICKTEEQIYLECLEYFIANLNKY